MRIELKYLNLGNESLAASLRKMMNQEYKDFDCYYWLKRLLDSAESHTKDIGAVQMKMFEKYGEKVVKDGADTGQMALKPENTEQYMKEFAEFLDTKVDIKYMPIPMSKIRNQELKLSPIDMFNLFPFLIDDIDVMELVEAIPEGKSEDEVA